MPTAVLRRYTPPTCTLEIAAAGSALSRWTDRTVVKNLRFQLSFDDPRLMPDQQVMVSGDQTQLEALCEIVSSYVQSLLVAAPEPLTWEASLRRLKSDLKLDRQNGAETESIPESMSGPIPESAPRAMPEIWFQTRTEAHPTYDSMPSLMNAGSIDDSQGISMQAQGLLSHTLKLGSLANEESGAAVRLSSLQLFDLANALEAYQTEALTLPVSQRPAWMARLPQGWASMAAAAVLALGATGAISKYVFDLSRPTLQTASAPQEREANSELSRELFPTLSPPPLEASPSITLQPLPPPPPDDTAQSGTAAPGLPPVGVTQPPASPQPAAPSTSADPQQVTILPNEGLPNPASAPAPANTEPPRLSTTGEAAPETDIAANTFASRAADSGEAGGSASSASGSDSDSTSAPTSKATAFDTIPQVAEIRDYFQQNWQPPADLDQTLEYRLLLNADGSLQRIVPLGQFSENYLDRTNMPLMGEPFVSATSDGTTPQIRLVLKPDGKVQSFLEYAN